MGDMSFGTDATAIHQSSLREMHRITTLTRLNVSSSHSSRAFFFLLLSGVMIRARNVVASIRQLSLQSTSSPAISNVPLRNANAGSCSVSSVVSGSGDLVAFPESYVDEI